jgi:excisionase family DNA binding protein
VTIKEAAERAGVNEMTIRRWIKAGKLSATLEAQGGNRVYRIDDDAALPPPTLSGTPVVVEQRAKALGTIAKDKTREIERMSAQLEGMRAHYDQEIERLRAENDRLAAANTKMMELHAEMVHALTTRPPEPEPSGWFARLFKKGKA